MHRVRYTRGPATLSFEADPSVNFTRGEWAENVSADVAEAATREGHAAEYGFEADPPIARDEAGRPA